jgi:hypothetical protein
MEPHFVRKVRVLDCLGLHRFVTACAHAGADFRVFWDSAFDGALLHHETHVAANFANPFEARLHPEGGAEIIDAIEVFKRRRVANRGEASERGDVRLENKTETGRLGMFEDARWILGMLYDMLGSLSDDPVGMMFDGCAAASVQVAQGCYLPDVGSGDPVEVGGV